MKWFKRAWQIATKAEGVHGFFTSDLAKQMLWPLGYSVLIVLSAIWSTVPLPYLLAAAALAFAAVVSAMLRLDEYRERTDPNGKIIFEYPILNVEPDSYSNRTMLKRAQLGISISNTANFTMQFNMDSIDTQFMGRVTTEKTYSTLGGTIPPKSIDHFRDCPISLNIPIPKEAATGRVKFKIAYWKHPKRKFSIERSVRIEATFDPNENQFRHTWIYE